MTVIIPTVLFAYARPIHLRRTLECLRQDSVPLIYAFCDGPKDKSAVPAVEEVRRILRGVDWCEVVMHERQENIGLGRSIRGGVSSVLQQHQAAIVYEDDLFSVTGTYPFLSAALRQYAEVPQVMSVTGWTHPRVTPTTVADLPYFDGRAECWVWGTWKRAWQGMERSALELMRDCKARRIDVYRYGADLPAMAEIERRRNIWAVRWLYLHIVHGGLCLRPPHSMVEHIGFDNLATNALDGSQWSNPPLQPCPAIPENWPEAVEHPQCMSLWQLAYGGRPPAWRILRHRMREFFRFRGN